MNGPGPQTPGRFGRATQESGLRFLADHGNRRLRGPIKRLKAMRFGPEALFVFLAAAMAGHAAPFPVSPGPAPSPAPSAGPSPCPSPRYRLVPYAFESAQERSAVPLLRFEDKADVRGLEMNAAIARFFEKGDDRGNMLRGATPGGAPTLRSMAPYRPHATPGMDLLSAAILAAKEGWKQIDRHRGMPPADPSPTPAPSPSARRS